MLPVGFDKSYWHKFSKYETYKNEKGVYIIPVIGSEKIIYDVYNIKDELIVDYLNFGKAIHENIDERTKINIALSLVKKYGLLGYFSFNKYEMDSINSDYSNMVTHVEDGYGNFYEEMPYSEFITEYFPVPNRQPPMIDMSSKSEIIDKWIDQFEQNYSERIGWIARTAYTLYLNFKHIQDFKQIEEKENLEDKVYFDKVFDCYYSIKNVELVIKFDEVKGATLTWSVDSLFKMLDIMYAMKLVDKKTGLATCKNCGNVFFKDRISQEYCSPNCGSSYRVKKCIKNKSKNIKLKGSE